MPQMSGVELARSIRERPELDALKMVVLSSSTLDRAPFADIAVSAFLAKPIRQAELLEALAGASPRVEARPAASTLSAAGRKVLIAEDNEINCAVAQALLGKRGLRTEIASNGREAIEMAAAGEYAASFIDCHMPELDGYETTRAIRCTERDSRAIGADAQAQDARAADADLRRAARPVHRRDRGRGGARRPGRDETYLASAQGLERHVRRRAPARGVPVPRTFGPRGRPTGERGAAGPPAPGRLRGAGRPARQVALGEPRWTRAARDRACRPRSAGA